VTAFARFPPRLQEAIASRLGWTSLRPVQELAGEAILDGKNAVVLAPTAGGKTEASMFQADAPSTVSSFMQRMGRSGRRAGTTANTSFYCAEPEAVLQAVAIVELARERWVEHVPAQRRCWPVLVHQLLALTLQWGGREHRALLGAALARTRLRWHRARRDRRGRRTHALAGLPLRVRRAALDG
jgi:Lhr-like helicase